MQFLIIVIICCLVIGSIFSVMATLNYFETSDKIEEYPLSSHNAGSSMPYPSYDKSRVYFGLGGSFFTASGIVAVIWRKRK